MKQFFNKKIIISIICFSFLFLIFPLFSVNAQDFYPINPNQTITIDKHGVCRVVSNETGSLSTFIPVKISDEWLQFRIHHPSHINLTLCLPSIPLNVTATAVSSSQIDVSWTAVSGATGYRVYRCTGTTCTPTTLVGSPTTTSFSNTGLAANTTYRYRVTAYNDFGESDYSNIATATTFPAIPSVPTNVSCSTVSSSQINVSWTAVSGATGYRVYRCTGTTCTPTTLVGSPTTTSFSNTSLAANTTYRYRVTAYNTSGESTYSSITTCTTQASIPTVPTNVSCSTVSSSQIDVSWTAVSGATGYRVYRCTGTTCTPTTLVGSPTTTSFSNTSLAANTTYRYRVTAYNTSGESTYSSITTCTTQASPASGSLSCYSSTENSITLYYSYSNGTSVSLFMGSSYIANLGSGSNSGYYNVSSLSAGTSYTFYLRNGTSSSSPLLASVSCSTQTATPPPSGSCSAPFYYCSRRWDCNTCLSEPFPTCISAGHYTHCCMGTGDYTYCQYGPVSSECCCCK